MVTKVDDRPEFTHYKDEGCKSAPSCLDCPFTHCLYDSPRGRQRYLKELRDENIKKLFNKGWKTKELALLYNVSYKTIERALNDDSLRGRVVRSNSPAS